MKLQKRSASSAKTGEKKPLDKIHVGFEVQTGEDGYSAVKQAVDTLRQEGYSVNARTITLILADQLSGGKLDKSINGLESGLEQAGEFLKTASSEDIVNMGIKAAGE